MKNGSTQVQVTPYDWLEFSWVEQSQDAGGNYTTIAWTLNLLSGTYGAIQSSASKYCTVNVSGQVSEHQVNVSISNDGEKILAHGTANIAHNADGTRAFSYSFMVNFAITFNGSAVGEIRGAGYGELTPISKSSPFAIMNTIYLGKANLLRITPASSSFRHTIHYRWITGYTQPEGYLAENTASTDINFTLPLDLALLIPNVKYGMVRITCITYNNVGAEIGRNVVDYNAYVDGSLYSPILAPTVQDIYSASRALTGDPSVMISGISMAEYYFNASAQLGATIVNRTIRNGKNEIINSPDDGTFTADGGVFYFEVEDSRGFKTIQVYRAKEVNYYEPTCEITDIYATAENELSFTIKGIWFNGNFGASENIIGVAYMYTEEGSSSSSGWQTSYWYPDNPNGIIIDGYTYSKAVHLTGVDYKKTYLIDAFVFDSVSGIIYSETKSSNVLPVFDWSKEDFNFNVPIYVKGIELPTVIEQGTSGIWTYRKWSDGTSECWGQKDFYVTFGTSTWGGMYTSGAISGSNVTFPSGLFNSTPNIQASLLTRSIGGILIAPGGAGSNIASSTQTGVYEICRGNTTSGAFTICYSVKGTWK